eukprot:1155930-Pelagomonas_calceolata.AAC.2
MSVDKLIIRLAHLSCCSSYSAMQNVRPRRLSNLDQSNTKKAEICNTALTFLKVTVYWPAEVFGTIKVMEVRDRSRRETGMVACRDTRTSERGSYACIIHMSTGAWRNWCMCTGNEAG